MMKYIEGDKQGKRVPEFTMKELSISIDSLIKGNRRTAKESTQKISKELTKKRQKWNLQQDHQATVHDSQFMDKRYGHIDLQERRPKKTWKVQTSLPTTLQFFSTKKIRDLTPISTNTNGLTTQHSEQFQTTDHFMTYKLLISQKCRQWRTHMWVAAIDFKKAFDSVQHDAIWSSQKPFDHWAILMLSKEIVVCWPTRHRIDRRGKW